MADIYEALASAIYLAKQRLGDVTDDDQRLRASGLYADWAAGSYAVGDIRNTFASPEGTPPEEALGEEWTQTWECFQAHDTAANPDIVPDNAAWFTFWRPLHGMSPETARPFVPVQGAHDMYRTGEYMVYTDGKTYKCLRDTSFSPEEDPQAWEAADGAHGEEEQQTA